MKTADKDRITRNFAVLASLVDMFRHLNDCCALVGRLDGKIVIDAGRTPDFLFDELGGAFLACCLASDSERLPIFSDLTPDEASQTVLLDADAVLRLDFESMMQYPALHEIRCLIEAIPPLPPDLANHFRLAITSNYANDHLSKCIA